MVWLSCTAISPCNHRPPDDHVQPSSRGRDPHDAPRRVPRRRPGRWGRRCCSPPRTTRRGPSRCRVGRRWTRCRRGTATGAWATPARFRGRDGRARRGAAGDVGRHPRRGAVDAPSPGRRLRLDGPAAARRPRAGPARWPACGPAKPSSTAATASASPATGAEVTVDPVRARPISGAADGSVRLLAADEVARRRPADLRPVACAPPGMITGRHRCGSGTSAARPHRRRRPSWWPCTPATTASTTVTSTTASSGRRRSTGYGRGLGQIIELIASSTAVELALWHVRLRPRPDPPVDARGAPARRCGPAGRRRPPGVPGPARYDEQWLRLLDVDAALGALGRTPTPSTASPSPCTTICSRPTPASGGSSRRGRRATEADPAAADLATDMRRSPPAYLGGTRWSLLAELGHVEVREPGAVAVADALFASLPRALVLRRASSESRDPVVLEPAHPREVSGHLVGSAAFKAVGTGDPRPAGSIPVHLRHGVSSRSEPFRNLGLTRSFVPGRSWTFANVPGT